MNSKDQQKKINQTNKDKRIEKIEEESNNQITNIIQEEQMEILTGSLDDQIEIDQEGMQFLESVNVNEDIEDSNIYDDSSDDQELMPKALPIFSMSDMDSNHTDYEGLQYLLNVRKEANKISKIMIAKNINIVEAKTDEKYILQSILKGEFSEQCKLSTWEENQLVQFKNFKKHLEYIDEQIQKGANPADIISNYYNGLEDDKYIKSKKCFLENFMNDDLTKIVIPSTQTLQKITYIKLEKILEYIDQVINDKLEIIESIQQEIFTNNPNNNQLFDEKKVFMNYQQFLWIYGLMGRLDNPILADISCTLNKILKISVFQQKNYGKEREDFQLVQAMTSMLIVIIREYYGQKYISI